MVMVSLAQWHSSTSDLHRLGVRTPACDTDALMAAGRQQPVWMHVGGGNLYRALHAQIAQDLADAGELDRGIVVLETRSPFTVDNLYAPYDGAVLQVVMNEDGTLDERLLAVTADALFANAERPQDLARARSYFASPELQLVTFTITEKGYGLTAPDGALLPAVEREMQRGPGHPESTMGTVAALLFDRFSAGAAPIALVSTDNFSRNGERFRDAVLAIVRGWERAGHVPAAFTSYVADEARVSFPWTMIDRITPNPARSTEEALEAQGLMDLGVVEARGGVRFAAFCNAEAVHYLVIEDSFPNGRPAFERAGVILTDRATAERADTMKVTTCLNPIHTCLALFGCLLGYATIAAEMLDADMAALAAHVGYDEGLPVVEDPGVIDPHSFIDEVLTRRLPNPSLPDTPQRIAADTSQKLPVRFGETIARYASRPDLDPADLVYIPLVLAAWLRYLLGVDDHLVPFQPSPDPLLDDVLQAQLAPVRLGLSDADAIHRAVEPILSNRSIFGCDLYEVGLGGKVEGYLREMLAGPGAVAATVAKYV